METERLGRYRLLRLVATGGMGEVFLARQEGPAGFSKLVVVKRILRHLASDESFVEMFLNEARLAALLSHPQIVQIFELGDEDGAYFIAMEYVHGKSVRSACTRLAELKRTWPPQLAAWVCAQALQGLQHAHALRSDAGELVGVVHRDISPENLLVSFEGNVKVADFGLAKAAHLAVTRVGRLKGKIAYVAPEQLLGERVDGRTDVYAIGVTLYEMLTGALPYSKPLGPADAQTVLKEPPVPLRRRNARAPAELEEIVLTALSKEPAQRFASAALMASGLEAFIRRSTLEASAPKVAELLAQLYGEEARMPAPSAAALEAPTGQSTRPLEEGSALLTLIDPSRASAPPRARWRQWAVVGAALLVSGAAAVGVFWRRPAPAPPVTALEPSQPPPASAPLPPEPAAITVAAPPVLAEAAPAHARPKHQAVGRVRVRVNPWADVLLDGQSLGTTPMPPQDVAVGAHVITLRNRDLGIERQVKVRVRPGAETLVKEDLLE